MFAVSSPAMGCACRPVNVGQMSLTTCPAELTLETLHHAAFHLDQGDDDASVRRDLAEVRAQIAIDQTGAGWSRGFVERIDAALGWNAERRQFEAELIRRDLHDSSCLPKELHARFHRRLPSVGSPPNLPPQPDHR